ncbi:unnamed protein product [Urochloa humidicola]
MEAEACCYATTATAFCLAESGLVCGSPKVPIRIFMERIHLKASRSSGFAFAPPRPGSFTSVPIAGMSWRPPCKQISCMGSMVETLREAAAARSRSCGALILGRR